MEGSGRHETPGSETKNYCTWYIESGRSFMLTGVPFLPESHRGIRATLVDIASIRDVCYI